MATVTLLQASELRVKLKALETQKDDLSLSFMDKLEIMDEILELKEQLGEFERHVNNNANDCEFCSA